MLYSNSLSIMSRRQAEDSAIARQDEASSESDHKEMGLLTWNVNRWIQHRETCIRWEVVNQTFVRTR